MQRTTRLSTERRNEIIDLAIETRLIELDDLTAEERHSNLILLNKLITTLLYEANRHTFDAAQCVRMRGWIAEIDPTLRAADQKRLAAFLDAQETQHHTYFGSYLSDNSDSEEERTFQAKPQQEKQQILNTARMFQQRGQIKKITLQRKSGTTPKGTLRTETNDPASLFNLDQRTIIHRAADFDNAKMVRDLNRLNQELKRRKLGLKATLEILEAEARDRKEAFTQFYLAEYRGVTHLTNSWNQSSRAAHRRENEIGEPQYSTSVHMTTGMNLFRQYTATRAVMAEHPERWRDPANTLKEILLTFREPRPYSYHDYTYSCLAYVIQNIYSHDYHGFRELIQKDASLKAMLLNDSMPFVSMGDTPNHPCKYAYGLKPYKGHEHERLRPRWRKDGKAERPYSGVIYTSLHPISDFDEEGPLHVVTLNYQAEIKLQHELNIVPERETCFPSYLQEGRVIAKTIAKYPNFNGHFKQSYEYKYGLTADLYLKFKQGFERFAPHTAQHKALKRLLGEWLCSYQEVRLIDQAQRATSAKGGVLIYRNNDGTFSLTPPMYSTSLNANVNTTEVKAPIKHKKSLRKQASKPEKVISPVATEEKIKTILESSYDYSDEVEPTVTLDGNHEISLPCSLMMNAMVNKRYRALTHFVRLPMFKDALNETFAHNEMQDCSLLHLAIFMKDNHALQLLLAQPECDPDQCANDFEIKQKDYYSFGNMTPLHLAVLTDNIDAVKQLLQAGASPHIGASLTSPKYFKVINPKAYTLREDAPEFIFHNTPLHLAAIFNRHDIAQVLIHDEVDIHTLNSSRCTALDLALCYGHADIEASLNDAENSSEDKRDSSFGL